MYRFLKKIFLFIRREHVAYTYESLADDPEFWSPDDSVALATFFKSPTGHKLRANLNNLTFRSATQACAEPVNGDYHRGIARGILITVQFLESKFPVAPPQVGNIDDASEQEQDVPVAF